MSVCSDISVIQRNPAQPFYGVQAIRDWENHWFADNPCSYGLMQQAAWAITSWLQQQFLPGPVQIICGTGNNGGDGWLIACYLQQQGWPVCVLETGNMKTADSQRARLQALAQGVWSQPWQSGLPRAGLLIDALLGIGITGPLRSNLQQVIGWMNGHDDPEQLSRSDRTAAVVIAVDVPSGLQADSGEITPVAVKADWTLCLIGLKSGLLTADAADHVGQLVTLPLIPRPAEIRPAGWLYRQVSGLPKRRQNSHKGSHGHVLVIGGGIGMGGAVAMAAEAALVAGAGKVSVLTHHSHCGWLTARCPALMVMGLPDQFTASQLQAMPAILARLDEVTVLAIGIGLGRDDWGREVWLACQPWIQRYPTIIDADGLYHLAHQQTMAADLAARCWFTPHPGEAATLYQAISAHAAVGKVSDNDVDAPARAASARPDRYQLVSLLQQHYGGSWLLKGTGSVVCDDQEQLSVCGLGNPGMATAGMGDVLAGLAAALRAQFDDATLMDAVLIHAAAGDRAAEVAGQRGMTSLNVIDHITAVMNQDAK